ncbi:hypothetical protein [Mycobacterium aquaticum]|nr:hypothetical protein [Mycobacterium aquaticum]
MGTDHLHEVERILASADPENRDELAIAAVHALTDIAQSLRLLVQAQGL